MSVKVMAYVWEHSKHTGTDLLMLLAIADHANDDGLCWPSIDRLAARCRVKPRQAIKIVQRLEASGDITVQRGVGRGHTSLYFIKGAPEDTLSPKGAPEDTLSEERVHHGTPFTEIKGALQRTKGVLQRRAYKDEPSIEPSGRKEKEEPPPAGAGSPPGGKRPRRKSYFPDDPPAQDALKATVWAMGIQAWCTKKGLTFNLDDEWEAFTRKALANDYEYKDWYSAFQNWLTSDYQTRAKNKATFKDDDGFLHVHDQEGIIQ